MGLWPSCILWKAAGGFWGMHAPKSRHHQYSGNSSLILLANEKNCISSWTCIRKQLPAAVQKGKIQPWKWMPQIMHEGGHGWETYREREPKLCPTYLLASILNEYYSLILKPDWISLLYLQPKALKHWYFFHNQKTYILKISINKEKTNTGNAQ